jgi:hypothetical protein
MEQDDLFNQTMNRISAVTKQCIQDGDFLQIVQLLRESSVSKIVSGLVNFGSDESLLKDYSSKYLETLCLLSSECMSIPTSVKVLA